MKNKLKISKYFNLTFAIFQAYLVSILVTFFIFYLCFKLNIRLDKFGSLVFLCFALIICFLISTVMTLLMTKKYKKMLKETSSCFNKLAHGDFNSKINIKTDNQFISELIDNINKIIEELNSITLLKKDFIKNFSHEFKTPIASIKGFSELLCNNPNLLEEERIKYYNIIREESTRLTNLANMTLLLSKLNSDNIELNKELVYIDESIEEVLLLLYNQIEEKEISVDVDLDHIFVSAAKDLIKEIWINIITNSIKFTNNKGTITIFSKISDEGYLFSFIDKGIGMSEDVKLHIFDEYYQGNTNSINQGIGLGLSICKKIIELHNWDIYVESTLDEGTTINIFIPKNNEK